MCSASTEKVNFTEVHCKSEKISYKSMLPAVNGVSRGLGWRNEKTCPVKRNEFRYSLLLALGSPLPVLRGKLN